MENSKIELDTGTRPVLLVLNHLVEVFQSIDVHSEGKTVDLNQTASEKSVTNVDILNLPFQGRDLALTMKLFPGVLQDPLGGLHLSGGAVNQVLYTLDGFNITDPVSGVLETRLNIDSVRSLQFATGRYSAEFGKGSAGVVAVKTDMGTDRFRHNFTNFIPGIDTESGIHIGTWSPRVEFSGPIVKGRAWFSESAEAAYSQLVVDDVKEKNRIPSLKADNLLRTQVNVTRRDLLFASFLVNYAAARGTGLSALDPYSTTVDRRSRTWFFSFKHDHYLSGGALLQWGYAEDRTFRRQIPQGGGLYLTTPFGRSGNFYVDGTEKSLRRQFLVNFSPRPWRWAGVHQFKIGMDLDRLNYEVNNRRTGYEQWGLNGYRLNRITFDGSGTYSQPSLEASGYLADSWTVLPQLVIDAGIRMDWDERLRNVALSPRLAAAWSPFAGRNTKLTGGYAVTRDSTSLQELARARDQYSLTVVYNPDGSVAEGPRATYFTLGNQRLRTPLYRNWSAGVEQRLVRNIVINGEFLRKRSRDGLTYLAVPIAYDPAVMARFELMNYRRDQIDSAEVAVRQSFGKQHQWMASYTRSRAVSNSVISLAVDQPLWVTNNFGRMPWDSPNRFLAMGHFPTPWRSWSFACLADARNGFPFTVSTDTGATVGEVNSHRFPAYFTLDTHIEKRLRFGSRYVALRGGFSNITNHQNPTVVNSMIGSPEFLRFYGSPGRHVVFRLRWLGTGEP